MAIRFGYACLNMTLGPKRGGFRSMIKRTFAEKGLQHASRLTLENVETLCGIIEWNNRHGIQVYRMTSDLAPWASEYEFVQTTRGKLDPFGILAPGNKQAPSFRIIGVFKKPVP